MALSQQKFREIVFQLLYSSDFSQESDEEIISFLMKEHAISKKNVYLAISLKEAVEKQLTEIDLLLKRVSKSYEFDRIPRVERNILRLGAYELLYSETVPDKVAIAEAIRMASKYASPEGATFVNAILDALYKEKTVASPAEQTS